MAGLTEKQLELLRGTNFGAVGTVGAGGRPQTSVVWVDTDGEHVIFNTTNARAKARNLRERPELSITIWDSADPYRYLEVEGRAELDEEGANEHIHELSQKYSGEPFHAPFDRVIVRIKPRRIFDHGIDAV
jgi:PPOX class probable F420-dependent enzyme